MPALRPLIVAALLAAAAPAAATAVPVTGARATYDGSRLALTAVVQSPPGGGCTAQVDGRWQRVPSPGRTHAAETGQPTGGTTAGIMTKTGADGAVAIDVCAEAGARPLWTQGRASVVFQVGALAPGTYRVCIRASQDRPDGGVSRHTACAAVRVRA